MVTRTISRRTQELRQRSQAHIFNTYGGVVDTQPDIIWEKGKGVVLTDTDASLYCRGPSFGIIA